MSESLKSVLDGLYIDCMRHSSPDPRDVVQTFTQRDDQEIAATTGAAAAVEEKTEMDVAAAIKAALEGEMAGLAGGSSEGEGGE